MPVFELRVALTVADFDTVTAFYRDGLGLDPGDLWKQEGGRGQFFCAGRGTLEIFDPTYANVVDVLEVGKRASGQIRLAFEVPDVQIAIEKALTYGATLISKPTLTPWGDLNARVQSPEGLQVTLFQIIEESEQP